MARPIRPNFPKSPMLPSRAQTSPHAMRRATLLTTLLALGACSTVEPQVVESRIERALEGLRSDFNALRLTAGLKRQVEGLESLRQDISRTRSELNRDGFQIENLAEPTDKARIKGSASQALNELQTSVEQLLNEKIPAYQELLYAEAIANTEQALEKALGNLRSDFESTDGLSNVIARYTGLVNIQERAEKLKQSIDQGKIGAFRELKLADATSLRSKYLDLLAQVKRESASSLAEIKPEYDRQVYLAKVEEVQTTLDNLIDATQPYQISYSLEGARECRNTIAQNQETLRNTEEKIKRGGYGLDALTAGDRKSIVDRMLQRIAEGQEKLKDHDTKQLEIMRGLLDEQRRIWGNYSEADVDALLVRVEQNFSSMFDQILCEFYSRRELEGLRREGRGGFDGAILANMNSREEAARQIQDILIAAKDYLISGRRLAFSGYLTPKDIALEFAINDIADQVYGLVDTLRVNPAGEPWSEKAFGVVSSKARALLDSQSARILSYDPGPTPIGRERPGRGGGVRGTPFSEQVLASELITLDRDLRVTMAKYLALFIDNPQSGQGTPRAEVITQLRQIFTDAKALLRGQKTTLNYTRWAYTKDNKRVEYTKIAGEIEQALQELQVAIDGTPYTQRAYGIIKTAAEPILDGYALDPANPPVRTEEPVRRPGEGRGPRGPNNDRFVNQEIETLNRDLNSLVDRTLARFSEQGGVGRGTPRSDVITMLRQIFTDAKAILRGQKQTLNYTSWANTSDGKRLEYTRVAKEICDALAELKFAVDGTPYAPTAFGVIKSAAEEVLDRYALTVGEKK